MIESRSVAIRVIGRVQGVWFRASTKSIANTLRLTGRVSNQHDGSVYIEASGNKGSIDEFIAWCRKGTELARVDRVEVSDIDDPGFTTFEISR